MSLKEFLKILPKSGKVAFFEDGMIKHSRELWAADFYEQYAFNPISRDVTIRSVHGSGKGLLLLCVHYVDWWHLKRDWETRLAENFED